MEHCQREKHQLSSYGVPRPPVQNKMKQNHMGKVGRKPVFTVIEDDVFTIGVEHICS